METKPIASNESVAAELRKLTAKWRAKAELWNADPEYREMFRPVSEVAHANVNQCADELEPLIARLEAPASVDPALEAPRTEPLPDVPLGERAFPRQGWQPVQGEG